MARLTKPLAVLVDDDPLFQKGMETVLISIGVIPLIVTDIDKFVHTIRSIKPEIFLIDLNLGKFGSGFDLISTIRIEKGPYVPIVVISANPEQTSVAHALELGANDYIIKTLDREFLASKLGRYLKSPALANRRQALFSEVAGGRFQVTTKFNVEITEIDEMGVKLLSQELLAKGSSLAISGSIMQVISGTDDNFLATITQNWTEADDGRFGAYAEFEPENKSIRHRIRKWLLGMNSKVPKISL